uniref:Reverse transcriptase Ty1/copia-type domain-containing protein n=1 Tax=Fagus sylvatica TaxID=28930 RepID=A0A2N9G457_FAGSY
MTQLDNMSMQMTSNKLDGTNYSAWSQFVELYVTGKGKLGYLTGEKIKPAISDPLFSTWVEENAMLMSWLLNSMTPDINASFLRLPTAHDIWDAVAQTYFTGNDASQIYELRRKAHETRQQGKSLASYFSALQTIWQELDFLNPYDMESAKDTATLKTRIENERVYDFLAGLDPGFDQIRVQVLAQDPTPNLRSTYAFVRREELRQAAMLASPPHESSALITIQDSPSALLNGYPDWFRKKGEGSSRHKGGKTESRAHTTTVHTPQPQYSQAQVDHILKEYAQRLSQKDASCSLANTGSTDHMTHESSNFSSYNTHPSKRCVKTANGSSSAVSGDLLTGTMIGLGRERDGLYYLDLNWHAKEDTGQVHQVVDAVLTAAYLINRMPSKVLQFQTPLQSLSKTHSLPTLLQIPPKVFGCVCYVHIHKQHRSKLDPRAQKCIFLGYSTTQKGYKCYHPPSTKILVSMDVTFLEDQAYFSGGDLEHSLQGENLQSEEKSWNVLPTLELNSVPSSVPSSGPALDSREQASLDQSNDQLVVPVTGNPEIVSSLEPTTPVDSHEALNNPRWKAAMVEEMEALQKNSTWKLVELPKDKKTVGSANLEWPLQQFDVKNAFLHGDLEEEVYMDFPPGFSTSSESGKVTALIVYVDDIVVTGNDIMEMGKLKTYLAKEFEIKDLGTLRYFLGIEVARSKEGIFVSQRKYVLDLLVETGMLACKPIDTPIEQNHRLGEDVDDTPVDRERYQKLVGKLIYLSHTRPDIAFAVSVVSQFMHAPCEKHMEAVYRILRYLKSAPGKGLMLYKNGHLEVEGYTDADWAGSITDRRSTSGYCTFVGGNLVTWRSKKQSVVARSSAEAEFRAMAHGICEMLWLKAMLKELGVHSKDPMKLYCDNKAAISIAHNPVQHDRTKHVEVDRHFIKEKLTEGLICTPFVRTENQLADILTKGVSNKIFNSALDKLGIRDIYAPA